MDNKKMNFNKNPFKETQQVVFKQENVTGNHPQ